MKIFTNGNFYSAKDDNSFFSTLIEDKGKIIFTGDEIPSRYNGIEKTDMNGKTILPAFGDNHMHFSSYAYFLGGFDWRKYPSIEEALSGLSDFLKKEGDKKIIVGFGSSAHKMAEKRDPDLEDLNRVSREKPIFIIKYDGHAGVGNSAFLKMLPEHILKLRGAVPEKGWFFNDSFFPAADFAAKTLPVTELVKSMKKASKKLLSYGISFVHTAEGVGYPFDLDVDMTRLVSKFLHQDFKVFFQTMNILKVKLRGLKQVGGCFDTALDGCFGSLDAALKEPYANDSKNKGILFYDDETVLKFIEKSFKSNLQVAVHAIGDAAVEQGVTAFSKADANYSRPGRRNIIIHGDLVSEEIMEKAADLNLTFAVQPSFLHWEEEPETYLESILGKRAEKLIPIRSLIQSGIVVTGGSDAPCTEPNPFHGIYSALNHPNGDERISLFEAIKLYTKNLAWSAFEEKKRGMLDIGMDADFLVSDMDIFSIGSSDIKNAKVDSMYIKGEKVV